MTCWAVTPIKAPQHCKTRLQRALSETARVELVASMLRHVVETASAAAGVDKVMVLSPSRHTLPAAVPLLPDSGAGLNAELMHALRLATEAGVERLLIIAADLPALTRQDVEALARHPSNVCAIAPDRAGVGTNALSLSLPAANDFVFQFGSDSFNLHCAEITRLKLEVAVLRTPTLALDIDKPANLVDLPEALRAFA